MGFLDHIKYSATPRHTSSAGFPGFDLNGSLTITGQLAARTFGTELHPFGDAVTDPEADYRLAAGALSAVDLESAVVFDFMVTNKQVFAFYERVRMPGTTYAAFNYAVPVATRTPDDVNAYSIVVEATEPLG